MQALGQPTTASARAAYHCKCSGSLPLQALGQPTIASARAAYHCKRSGSLPLQALGQPTTASARAAYHCRRSGSLPLQALGQPTTASARAAYHCKRSGSLPLQALGQPTTASARAAYLVVLQCLDELLAGLEQHDPGASVPLALKLYPGPGGVQLLQRLLHAQLLRGLVHNVAHLVLKDVQVQSQQVCQVRLL